MPTINIDTTSAQYTQLLAGLGTLRTVLAPRIKFLLGVPRAKRRAWLQRDPLLRRTLKLAQTLQELIHEEIAE